MNLAAWDVLWPYDPRASPPKPKLWVCVEPEALWFLRINSKPSDGSVLLAKTVHPFLEQDSWLHCYGELIETNLLELASLLDRQGIPQRRGIVGTISCGVRPAVLEMIPKSPLLAPNKVEAILACLRKG